jgi:protein-S-isoprenylcysteine O-methyltransferase Ste14
MLAGFLILACWVLLALYWNLSARSIKSVAKSQSWTGRLARVPVWLGFILLGVAVAYPLCMKSMPRTAFAKSLGVAICALGVIAAIWSRKTLGDDWSQDIELKQGRKLVQRGPYRLVRHPIYTCHLLMGLGTAIVSGSLVGFAELWCLFVGFWIKLKQEEVLFLTCFPEEYPAYKARVRALVPFLF